MISLMKCFFLTEDYSISKLKLFKMKINEHFGLLLDLFNIYKRKQ